MTHPSPDDAASRHGALPGDALPDEELLAAVRAGDTGAYAALYRRHLGAALAQARRLVGSQEGQDVAQEAFLKVLRAITRGGGPQDGFAAYLMRAVHNEAIDRLRRSREAAVEDVEDVEAVESVESSGPAGPADAGEQLDRDLLHRAFSALPHQWQRVLWLTEVDGMAPREVAPQLRRSPNAVAQLSRRAREGLRSAWLQAHVDRSLVAPGCRQTAGELGAYERGQLSAARTERTAAHLEDCVRCSVALRDLQALSTRMRGVLLPLALGSPGMLEQLSEVLPLAERAAEPVPAPKAANVAAGAAEAGARQPAWWRASAGGLGVPVAAAGVAVLVGAAGLALVHQRPGSDAEALTPSQEVASPVAVGVAPLETDGPVEPAGPTPLPAVEEDDAPGVEESAPGTSEAVDGSPAPAASPGDGASSARPGPATPAESSPAVEVPSGGGASPAPGVPPATEAPPTAEVPPAVDPPPAVEDPPASGGPSGPLVPPEVPDPPFLGGETPTKPPDGLALPPADPTPSPVIPVPPPDEPAEASEPEGGDGAPGLDETSGLDQI